MAEGKWFRVTRRYTVEESVFVRATSKSEALGKCREGDYEYIAQDMETVSRQTWKGPREMADAFDPRNLQ